jgi:hypothetical protein
MKWSLSETLEIKISSVVPAAEQGQDESVLLNKGTGFLKNKTNILYDIHAYEKRQ